MKNSKKIFLLAIIGMATFTSCNQDDPVINQLPYDDIKELLAEYKPQSQIFTIDPASTTTLTLAKGTEVIIYPNAICDMDGNPVSGAVSAEFKEVYSKTDMIFEEKTTISDGLILESGGEFFIDLTKDNEELQLCGTAMIKMPISDKTSDPMAMELFIGDDSGDEFNWVPDSIQAEFWTDTATYNFFLYGDFEWINCDYFYNEAGPKATVYALPVGNEGTVTNTISYIVFKDINSVAPFNYDAGTGKFKSYEDALPVGMEATVIIIGMSETAFYYGAEDIIISDDLTANVVLTEVTEAELISAMEDLN